MGSRRISTGFLAAVISIAACGETPDELGSKSQALNFNTADPGFAAVASAKKAKVYLVRLKDAPAMAYDGSIAGLPATKPAPGTRFDRDAKAVRNYVAYLIKKQDKLLKASGGKSVYKYKYSFNGFSALLTPAQAAMLENATGVLSVEADVAHRVTTDTSPTFLGLNTSGGTWDQLGGAGMAGENVIIGVIDTGIWPEHPSFSDQIDLADRGGASGKDTLAYGPAPAHWKGVCQAGEQWSKDDCNNKLIGARYYMTGFGHQGAYVNEYLSARDSDGHGTHTASTAGGNANVPAEIMGSNLGLVSGVAPRARIAAYKACWKQRCASGLPHCYEDVCYTSDLTAAIDDAASDGVDVINYSIGADAQVLLTADSIAFLYAADANVFVATSAGNAGPGAYTVGTPAVAPWVTSVGANTHNRTYQATATLGNGASYSGASLTGGTASLSLVDSADAASELCYPGALDATAVAGKIVLCKRGAIARVDKSLAVQLAGGAGMILYNADDAQTEVTDNHYVPAVHISNTQGLAIKAYIAGAGGAATAALSGGLQANAQGSVMAAFSSRGPNGADLDLLKPDVTAPGVNILAGNTPEAGLGAPGQLFQAISGTSMSSPHVAGAAALIKQAHRDWSPAMIKSAMMTTARQNVFKEDGATPADPFDMGAGHIAPTPALDPGLVYDANIVDHYAFLCGKGAIIEDLCNLIASWGYSFDAADLNLASFALGNLAGQRTVMRRVKNVGSASATYAPTASVPGVQVSFYPPTLTLAPGQTGFFFATFTVTSSATLDQWTYGSLSWSDGAHVVRSPVVVRPTAISAPAAVSGTGTAGSTAYDVTFGFAGDFAAAPHGLVAASVEAGNVIDDPANDINVALGTGVGMTMHVVDVPAGSVYARFALFDGETDGANDDLDLYVFDPFFNFAGGSGSASSAERVDVAFPTPGTYYVIVHGWQTEGPDANYLLSSWAVPMAAAGNLSVQAPAAATLGGSGNVQLDWNGLESDKRYLGLVSYVTGGHLVGATVVNVNTK